MAAKKSKETKESDEEFLKGFMQKKEEATRRIKSEMDSYSEAGEFREKGKQIGKQLEIVEECKKIIEEFKINPPIYESIVYNGVAFSYICKDSSTLKKIEFLEKNNFGFLRATKTTEYLTINFNTFGKTYIKRGGLKILLPESSKPVIKSGSNMGMGGGVAVDPKNLDFLIKDGDILGTERGGYIYGIKDVTDDSENVTNDIMIFPESEIRIIIRTETKTESGGIKSSSYTTNTNILEKVEFIKGLFKFNFLRKGKDVNGVIALPSNYPRVEFGPASAMAAKYFNQMAVKSEKSNPKIANLLALVASKSTEATMIRSGGKCDDIASFIELVDGSVVLFGTPNNIIHAGIGKETKKIDPRKKITLTQSAFYETDCSKDQDPRVEMIMKMPMAVITYNSLLTAKKELEENKSKKVDLAEEDRKIREDDQQMLKNAEDMGDDDMVNMVKQGMKVHEEYIRIGRPNQMAEVEVEMRKAEQYVSKTLEESKRLIEASLPSYNSPSEKDKV
jgi:hypothetical protein